MFKIRMPQKYFRKPPPEPPPPPPPPKGGGGGRGGGGGGFRSEGPFDRGSHGLRGHFYPCHPCHPWFHSLCRFALSSSLPAPCSWLLPSGFRPPSSVFRFPASGFRLANGLTPYRTQYPA